MYLYFDRYGTLKEQITFNPARVGNSNVNKIFVYWEGVEEFPDWAQELALQTRYLLQDNTQYPSATTFGFSAQPETAELPFDKNQDLKYFKYYKEYKFLTIDIPDEVLSYNGAVKSYIWVLNADKKRILGLGVFAFMVDGDINEVIPDENISLAQWNMISAQLGLLSGSVIDVTCDIETNTLKVYYANGLTAVRNLPPNGAQTTISSDFLREMIFSADTWVQDGENGYYIYFRAETVGYTDNRFFVQLEKDGGYNSDYYNKTGSFVLSDNIFKGSDGSVLLYSNEPYSGRLLVVGGKLLSGDSLVTGLTYNDVNSQLTYKTADGITHSIYLGIEQKFDKSNVSQTTGDSTVKVMSQKVTTDEIAALNSDLGKLNESIGINYLGGIVYGNFSGSDISINVDGIMFGRSEILENFGECVIRSGNGFIFNIYFGDEVTSTSSSGWQTEYKLDKKYTVARIRINNETITDLRGVDLSKIIVIDTRKYEKEVLDKIDKSVIKKEDFSPLNYLLGNGELIDFTEIKGYIVNSSGGFFNAGNTASRTDFIPIYSDLLILNSPVKSGFCGWYDEGKNFISPRFIIQKGVNRIVPPQNAKYFVLSESSSVGIKNVKIYSEVGKYIFETNRELFTTESVKKFESDDGTITTKFSLYIPKGNQSVKNMMITLKSKYTGDRPKMFFGYLKEKKDNPLDERFYYSSPWYLIGGNDSFSTQQFRIPPFPKNCDWLRIDCNIVNGSSLIIDDFHNEFDNSICKDVSGINLFAHGHVGGCPAETMSQFEMASRLGYKYCITIPKVTSDGIYVCLHNDNDITETARNDDGTVIAEEYHNRPVSDFTYNELRQFDFGIFKGDIYKGQRIPLLEDFFKLCAITGMHPTLSVHPNLVGHWGNIKALAKKYNVLNVLNIKASIGSETYPDIEVPMSVLGNDVESYTIDVSQSVDNSTAFAELLSRNNIDRNTVRCVIEFNNIAITDDLISSALNNGFKVGCFNYGSDGAQVVNLINKGVTEFTEDNNCSVGLNWL